MTSSSPSHIAILPQYSGAFSRAPSPATAFAAVVASAALYGAAVGLFADTNPLALTLPLLLLALAVIWVLPETNRGPVRVLNGLFFAFLVGLVLWPDYLALDVLNLPWITMRRLISAPLAILFLVSLSMSTTLRREVKASLSASPVLTRLFLAFLALQFISVALSSNMPVSMDKLVVAQLYWTLPFFVGCYVFRKPGLAERWAALLCLMLVPLALIGLWEWSRSLVPWAGRIPSFLKVEDLSVQRILAGAARAASGKYRVQSTFSTSLGYAEYMAMATPFLIHFAIGPFRLLTRILAILALPAMFFMIVLTDSRLGAAGFLLSFVLYVAGWAVLRWRHHRDSLFGPALTIAYPAFFALFITATFFVGRLRRMVWGGGEHSFSTEAREDQYAQGLDILARNPIGHGIGMGAETLGFQNLAGVLTIDTFHSCNPATPRIPRLLSR